MRVTVLADTHGLLRPRVLELARGSDLILHAGDVGDPAILEELALVTPVRAVQGNVDIDIDIDGRLARLPDRLRSFPSAGARMAGRLRAARSSCRHYAVED